MIKLFQSPATKTSLGASSAKATTATKLTPTRKPLSSASKLTSTKSPKVPNGAVGKTKAVPKTTDTGAAKSNGTEQLKTNGHIAENGTGANKIIDVSAD